MDIRPEGGDLLPKADERTERRTGRQTLWVLRSVTSSLRTP
jgi:hypothetical protein